METKPSRIYVSTHALLKKIKDEHGISIVEAIHRAVVVYANALAEDKAILQAHKEGQDAKNQTTRTTEMDGD